MPFLWRALEFGSQLIKCQRLTRGNYQNESARFAFLASKPKIFSHVNKKDKREPIGSFNIKIFWVFTILTIVEWASTAKYMAWEPNL